MDPGPTKKSLGPDPRKEIIQARAWACPQLPSEGGSSDISSYSPKLLSAHISQAIENFFTNLNQNYILILLHLLIVTKVIWMLMMKILMILKTRK
jgi:hypothetical protein